MHLNWIHIAALFCVLITGFRSINANDSLEDEDDTVESKEIEKLLEMKETINKLNVADKKSRLLAGNFITEYVMNQIGNVRDSVMEIFILKKQLREYKLERNKFADYIEMLEQKWVQCDVNRTACLNQINNCGSTLDACITNVTFLDNQYNRLYTLYQSCLRNQSYLDNLYKSCSAQLQKIKQQCKVTATLITLTTGQYLFVSEKLEWSNAAAYCASRGLQLVVFETAAEANAVTNYYKVLNGYSTDFWIGLSRNPSDSEVFEWWNRDPAITSYNNWKSNNEPKNGGDCVAADGKDSYKWDARNCKGISNSFVCEPSNICKPYL